jgi:type IV secretion system protein VirB4
MNRGFTTLSESMNATEAWLGSLPGNVNANERRPILSSFNLAHLLPYASPYAGEPRCEHLDGPPLLHVDTEGYTPFRLNLHVGDVGHTLVIGPTGSGKTTLLGLLAAQFLRYPQAQIYIFDRRYGLKVITRALGGRYHDLADGKLAFQPLRHIDKEAERLAVCDWLSLLLPAHLAGQTAVATAMWDALSLLAREPETYRTLSNLQHLLGDPELRAALMPYTLEGPFGALFDARSETLSLGAIEGFELEAVSHQSRVLGPLLTYLFRRIETRLTGRPTLIIIDEAWAALDHELFCEQIGDWVRTLRRLNTSVVFATQNLGDLMDKRISSVIFESCPTQLLLPNPRALEAESARLYQAIGLNEVEMQALAVAEPKQAYFYRSPLGQRWFSLSLGESSRVLCGSSRKADLQLADDIPASGPAFAAAFLAHHGLDWAADLLREDDTSRMDTSPAPTRADDAFGIHTFPDATKGV